MSEIIERVSEIAREITLIHDRTISKSINCEDSDVMIDSTIIEESFKIYLVMLFNIHQTNPTLNY